MAGGSTLDPDVVSDIVGSAGGPGRKGADTGSLGPSDSTDSGADVAGGPDVSPDGLATDSDAEGTGERAGAGRNEDPAEEGGFDRIVDASEAGLGTGPDEVESVPRQD